MNEYLSRLNGAFHFKEIPKLQSSLSGKVLTIIHKLQNGEILKEQEEGNKD